MRGGVMCEVHGFLPDVDHCQACLSTRQASTELPSSGAQTPRTDAIKTELHRKYPDPLSSAQKVLYYMEAAETYGQECRALEMELAALRKGDGSIESIRRSSKALAISVRMERALLEDSNYLLTNIDGELKEAIDLLRRQGGG